MKAGKPDRARAALERIGSADYADRILRDIAHTLEKDNHKISYGALLAPQVKPIVIIGMVSPSSSSGAELTSSLTTRRRFLPRRDSILTAR